MLRYAFTIFLSAFLLFQIQPLIGRFALPWFGGGPSIWTTCMLFFQLLLLGGYMYAHLLTMLAWCSQRMWLNKPVPAFWIWIIAIGAQLGSIGYFMVMPLNALMSSNDRAIVFGGYAILQILGLMVTAVLERKTRIVSWVWISLALLQLAWLCGFSQWYFPKLMAQQSIIAIALGTAVPTLLSLIALWLIDRRSEPVQRTMMRVFFMLSVALFLVAFWVFKSLERWQIVTAASACLAALLLEFGIARLRAAGARSWGLWFWIPAGTLLVLLCMRLVVVIQEDDYDIAQVSRNLDTANQ